MAISNQVLAGTTCLVVIGLVFAATSKKSDNPNKDRAPATSEKAQIMKRLLTLQKQFDDSQGSMSADDILALCEQHRDIVTDGRNLLKGAQLEEFDAAAAISINLLTQSWQQKSQAEGPPEKPEQVPGKLDEVRKTTPVVVDEEPYVAPGSGPGHADFLRNLREEPSFQQTPSNLDDAVDRYANTQQSVAVGEKSAFTTSGDKLNRPENRKDDPFGEKLANDQAMGGFDTPTTDNVAPLNIESTAEPSEKIDPPNGSEGLNPAPTFSAMSDPAPSKPPKPPQLEPVSAPKVQNLTEALDRVEQTEALYNSTNEVQFGSNDFQTRLDSVRQKIAETNDIRARTELIEKLKLMSAQTNTTVTRDQAAGLAKIDTLMTKAYKFNLSFANRSPETTEMARKRLVACQQKVAEIIGKQSNAGGWGTVSNQVKLDAEILKTLLGGIPPARVKRARSEETVGDLGVRDRDPEQVTKRPRTSEVVDVERSSSGEPARQKSRN